MSENNIKRTVREFYDQVGWQSIGDTLYQNAQYEDLRPVSQEYLHRCHMRVKRHLAPEGIYYLDAGSGPVQYPEYLTYSEGYRARVCMDISIVALKEARKRLGEHGFFVLGDVSHLPFAAESFDGLTALHTIHHVPMEDKGLAYNELHRVLKAGHSMVVVDGWTNALLMVHSQRFMTLTKRVRSWWERKILKTQVKPENKQALKPSETDLVKNGASQPAGTFVQKFNADGLIELIEGKMDFEILVWRSVSVAFLRSVIYPDWGGKFWLKILYGIEELFPRLLGRVGQYPLIVVTKPDLGNKRDKEASEV